MTFILNLKEMTRKEIKPFIEACDNIIISENSLATKIYNKIKRTMEIRQEDIAEKNIERAKKGVYNFLGHKIRLFKKKGIPLDYLNEIDYTIGSGIGRGDRYTYNSNIGLLCWIIEGLDFAPNYVCTTEKDYSKLKGNSKIVSEYIKTMKQQGKWQGINNEQ